MLIIAPAVNVKMECFPPLYAAADWKLCMGQTAAVHAQASLHVRRRQKCIRVFYINWQS